jgi:hypothetical protein
MTTPIAVGERVTWTQVSRSYGHIVRQVQRTGTVLSIDKGWALIRYDGTLPYHGCVRPGKLTRIEAEPSSRVVDGAGDEEVVG